jgi:hypothetical protein
MIHLQYFDKLVRVTVLEYAVSDGGSLLNW